MVDDRTNFMSDKTIFMSQEGFTRILQGFSLDRYVLELVTLNWYGFYESPSTTNDSQTILISTTLYVLAFSFHPDFKTTAAICLSRSILSRDKSSCRDGEKAVDRLENLLRNFAAHLNKPSFLVVVVLIHLLEYFDEQLDVKLNTIRKIEANIGHGPDGFSLKSRSVGQLIETSYKLGKMTADLSSVVQHQAIATSMVEFVRNCVKESSSDEPGAILKVLEQRLKGVAEMVKYLQGRLQGQLSVIWARIGHIDAEVSNELTEVGNNLTTVSNELAEVGNNLTTVSNELATASKDLAKATAKDSSSMKTIAVMTMAFLPGTFFAALFAIPSLKWDQPGVVQQNFWVYWAFTLPFTALVFGIWKVATKRSHRLLNKQSDINVETPTGTAPRRRNRIGAQAPR
ncbi:hypothetical protein ACJ41O_003669 [Fusarium nematophilum]